ncbi:MAG: hypothetical protein JCHSAcid_01830 [uncultured Acidilobus sp. JCHS]|nr:MAG: hypothetical protein OSP8Acid_02740 [uncultured Acidilobus sp. OSP8]ESQ26531.1 MAG: hypothetical protein JCHSAcid_01830 [uncultured Acidilobus sp. JCHS]
MGAFGDYLRSKGVRTFSRLKFKA